MIHEAFVPFEEPILDATFLGRRRRFLADMRLPDGTEVVAHCANTGSLETCLVPGAPALLWDSRNPKRKLQLSWKAIRVGGVWVGVDTGIPNRLVEKALAAGLVPELAGAERILRERPMGKGTRVDLVLEGIPGSPTVFVEVKNVTMVEDGVAMFPDAVTSRGLKHLRELTRQVEQGSRAAMVYLVQREDGRVFRPAGHIDPAYAEGLRDAVAAGVEAYAILARVSRRGVEAVGLLPVEL